MKKTISTDFECIAPDSVFAPDYEDIPKQYQEIIEKHNGIGCCGTGESGPDCILPKKCPFAEWDGEWEFELTIHIPWEA